MIETASNNDWGEGSIWTTHLFTSPFLYNVPVVVYTSTKILVFKFLALSPADTRIHVMILQSENWHNTTEKIYIMTISLFILPYQKHLLLIFLSQSVKWHVLTQSSASNRVWGTLWLYSIAGIQYVHLWQLMRPSGTALFFRDENFLSIGLTLVTKHPGKSPISCKYSNQMDPDFLSFQRPQISDSGVPFTK